MFYKKLTWDDATQSLTSEKSHDGEVASSGLIQMLAGDDEG